MRLQEISQAPHPLADIATCIERNPQEWHAFYNHEAPESTPMPDGLSDRLNLFEQLLVRVVA